MPVSDTLMAQLPEAGSVYDDAVAYSEENGIEL